MSVKTCVAIYIYNKFILYCIIERVVKMIGYITIATTMAVFLAIGNRRKMKQYFKSKQIADRKVFGGCAWFANQTNINVKTIRVAIAICACVSGAGLLPYAILCACNWLDFE